MAFSPLDNTYRKLPARNTYPSLWWLEFLLGFYHIAYVANLWSPTLPGRLELIPLVSSSSGAWNLSDMSQNPHCKSHRWTVLWPKPPRKQRHSYQAEHSRGLTISPQEPSEGKGQNLLQINLILPSTG